MMKMLIGSFILAGLSFVSGCVRHQTADASSGVLYYEPEIVRVTGVVRRETQPGPPNWESIEYGDQPVTYWILKADKPYSVCNKEPDPEPDPEVGGNIDVDAIGEFQLVLKGEMYDNYRHMLNHRVVVTGTLYHRHTGWHFKTILLQVQEMREVAVESLCCTHPE
jgi:hypothetical protein